MAEYRRILLDDVPVSAVREGNDLVTENGERIAIEDATHLPPVEPTKIIATHLTYVSWVEEFKTKLPIGTHLLPQTDHLLERSLGRDRPTVALQIPQLRR